MKAAVEMPTVRQLVHPQFGGDNPAVSRPRSKSETMPSTPNMGRPAGVVVRPTGRRGASVRAYHLQHVDTIALELALADAADLR